MGHGLSSWSKYRFSVPGIVDVPLGQVLASGFYGTAPTVLAVDSAGRLIALIYGKDGVAQRQVVVDADGQIIMVPRGQSGNYLNVDASGYLTSVIKGLDGVTLRTVAVDAAGKILGVLQGDYAGELKTLAVDSQGRMLAVLTDPEDVFGNPHYLGAAELAARLGSINTFERRGNVVFMDDFEHGLGKWYPGTSGTGASIVPTVDYVAAGGMAAKLTAGSDSGRYAQISHISPYLYLSKLGFELAWSFMASIQYIRLYFRVYDGTTLHVASLRWTQSTQKWEVYDKTLGWVTVISSWMPPMSYTLFHVVKLVFNPATDTYVRALVDSEGVNLAAYSSDTDLDNTEPQCEVLILVVSNTGENAVCRVDNVIITQNEP